MGQGARGQDVIPTRIVLAVSAAALLAALVVGAFVFARHDAARDAIREREAAEQDAINKAEKGIADAIDRCADLPWHQRLQADCER